MVEEEEEGAKDVAGVEKMRAPKRERFPFLNTQRRELREISSRESLPLDELFD